MTDVVFAALALAPSLALALAVIIAWLITPRGTTTVTFDAPVARDLWIAALDAELAVPCMRLEQSSRSAVAAAKAALEADYAARAAARLAEQTANEDTALAVDAGWTDLHAAVMARPVLCRAVKPRCAALPGRVACAPSRDARCVSAPPRRLRSRLLPCLRRVTWHAAASA